MQPSVNSVVEVPIRVAGADDDLEYLFQHYYRVKGTSLVTADKRWLPPTDLFETQGALVIVMDIAGIDHHEVSVRVEGHTLTIKGLRREFSKYPKRNYYLMEIDFGPFERRFNLPCMVDVDRIQAHYNAGFLEVVLPKKSPGTSHSGTIQIAGQEDDDV